ncbi:hypothetical protein [Actinomycetospora chibensis]|uniref:Protein kinase domain-containing protein n=1 Tax=Actinomycetospora chibensis TaxID=663606 RepID=A0ABV9RKB2_9PSEU|nr:hypothetical protein [Actinomycetospora chibensis]MDD7923323.1 hypothetical protein [Actinomycetospora chibensis]
MTDGETLSGGHYRLGSRLTGGGAGRVTVRAAHDEWGDRDVVAVALAPDGGHGPPAPDALTRVARDIRRVASAVHPGLAPADDVAAGADRGLWLVHDLPAGVRGLADDAPVAPAAALRRAVVLAGALGAAHAARVVHGRVGAEVVLVGGDDAVWLLGAASGVRPSDRPGAEDDDTRALAATLLSAGTDDSEPELAARLAAVLERAAHATPEVPGDLGATLRHDLGDLGGTELGEMKEAPPVRLTEVIPTATATGAWSPTRPMAVEPATGADPAHERTTTPVLVAPHGRGPAAPVLPHPGNPARRPVGVGPPRPSGPPPAHPVGPGAPPRRPEPEHPATRTSLVVLAVAVVVLLLAGAVAAVLVLGSDAAPVGPSDRVVPAAIGDPRTVDPCGLVDPAALAARAGGEARAVPDLGDPAACVVDVATPGGDIAVIATLEPVATTVSAAQEERVGALLVRRITPRAGSCTRTVVTIEGVQVSLDAIAPAGAGADPCAAADTATDTTLRVLQQGTTLPRRATEDPPTALTSVDTCSLLTRSDLGAVPGLDLASVVPGVGGWSCRWGTGAGSAVDVGVERRRAFAPTTDVAGRQAAVTPQQTSCDVALAQRAYTATDGTPRVELLEVTVFGARPADALCADATRLAAATVPRLPPP